MRVLLGENDEGRRVAEKLGSGLYAPYNIAYKLTMTTPQIILLALLAGYRDDLIASPAARSPANGPPALATDRT